MKALVTLIPDDADLRGITPAILVRTLLGEHDKFNSRLL